MNFNTTVTYPLGMCAVRKLPPGQPKKQVDAPRFRCHVQTLLIEPCCHLQGTPSHRVLCHCSRFFRVQLPPGGASLLLTCDRLEQQPTRSLVAHGCSGGDIREVEERTSHVQSSHPLSEHVVVAFRGGRPDPALFVNPEPSAPYGSFPPTRLSHCGKSGGCHKCEKQRVSSNCCCSCLL